MRCAWLCLHFLILLSIQGEFKPRLPYVGSVIPGLVTSGLPVSLLAYFVCLSSLKLGGECFPGWGQFEYLYASEVVTLLLWLGGKDGIEVWLPPWSRYLRIESWTCGVSAVCKGKPGCLTLTKVKTCHGDWLFLHCLSWCMVWNTRSQAAFCPDSSGVALEPLFATCLLCRALAAVSSAALQVSKYFRLTCSLLASGAHPAMC